MTVQRRRANLRGFTMIELIVVVVIMGVMAAAIVPRMFGNEARAAENEVRLVRGFLSTVATRAALSSQGLGIRYTAADAGGDGGGGRLELLSLRARGNAGDFAAEREYLPDPVTLPVELTRVRVSAFTAGGVPANAASAWVEFAAGSPRPTVVIVMTYGVAQGGVGGGATKDASAWRVELPGDESRAVLSRTDLRDAGVPAFSRAVDLDKAGGSQTPW
jgi:prepilin-type N-terminal cleavage/methylation domain-containing protein